jgi:hypothetical protein
MARRKPKALTTMGEPEQVETLIDLFKTLRDPRVDRTKDYPLEEILFGASGIRVGQSRAETGADRGLTWS